MHVFYDYNSKFLGQQGSEWIGLVSMAMYLIFWGVVTVVAYRLIKKHFFKREIGEKEDRAIEILRERYAKGEIEFEEFTKKKADLDQEDQIHRGS